MKENSWKELFGAMPFPCLILKPEKPDKFFVLEVNDAYLELVSTSREDWTKQDTNQAFPTKTNGPTCGTDALAASLKKLLKTGEKQVVETLRFNVPGRGSSKIEERYFSSENIPFKDKNGNIEYILLTLREMTFEPIPEQKEEKPEQELHLDRQQFKTFFRGNPDGLYRLDLEGNFLHVNEALATMAEYPEEALRGRNFLPFCAPHHKELTLDNFRKACQGKIASFEADFISASGKKLILKVLLMPVIIDGEVTELHGISRDVTEVRKTEKVMVEKSRFLEANAVFISVLLETEINDTALHEAFGVIARTIEADRMYYFGAVKNSDTGEILISQKVEWCSQLAEPQIENPNLQNIPLTTVEEITPQLSRNLPFTATKSELKEGELKNIFEEEDIQSMLLLPIFVEEKLFGFIGFDDCKSERIWEEEEISFLKSLTQNLTNAFEKKTALEKVRKREEELKLSEQKFRSLVQEGSDLIGILDKDGIYSFVSENYRHILGFEPEDLIDQNAFCFIHPDDWERVKEQFLLLKEQKQVKIAPFRFKNKEGVYKWVQTTATNLLKDPAVNGIVANSRDVTTIIEQAREIEHINERYQLAATATEDLIYDWNLLNQEVTRFHRGSREFFGFPSEEVNKRRFWQDHIHPEDLEPEKAKLALALSDPEKNYIKSEYRFRRADGTYAEVVDKGYIIRNFEGKAIRLIGATSDISEITEKKEALKIANKRFRMAMKATNEVIWDWEIGSDSVVRSKGYKDIFGYDTNEATSVHSFWMTKVAPEDRKKLKRSLTRAIQDPKAKKWQLEYKLIKANGETAYVIDRGYIIREKGKAKRMVGAVLDVTHSRRLLSKIQSQNKVLKDIAWEQSHTVRAPLARIQGLLHLLEEDANEIEMSREQILFHIRESASELDGIIRNIVGKTEKINVEIQ